MTGGNAGGPPADGGLICDADEEQLRCRPGDPRPASLNEPLLRWRADQEWVEDAERARDALRS